ncbi:MAG: ABC transporter permease [Candidatus Methanomethylophilaceae archaeon]
MSNISAWLMEDPSKNKTSSTSSRKGGFRYDPENKYHRITKQVICAIISLVGLYIIWDVASILINRNIVPTPLETWDALVYFVTNGDPLVGGTIGKYVSASFGTLLKGFFLALIVAYPFGLLLGTCKTFRELSNPAINVLRPIAPVAWAPILVILLNSGTSGAMMVVFIGVFFPLLTNVVFGVTKTDKNWIDATRTLGATKLQTFLKVTIPASVPYLMTGIKTGVGIGWMCIVSAELYASTVGGMGNFITNMAQLGAWPYVYAGIVVIGILGLITVSVVEILNRFVDKKWGAEE